MNILNAILQWWKERETWGEKEKTRELQAFLPAALEIQDKPPNPLVRRLSITLMAFFIIAVLWACFGEVNIVASAEGKIVPSSRIKTIQPLSKAVVKQVLVKEGQKVVKGQALVELDATITHAEQAKIQNKLEFTRQSLMVHEKVLALLEKAKREQVSNLNLSSLSNSVDLTSAVNEPLNSQVKHLWLQYQSKNQVLDSNLLRIQAEQKMANEVLKKLTATLPLVTKRKEIAKTLTEDNFFSEMDYLTLEQQHIEMSQDLAAEHFRTQQLSASYQELVQQKESFYAETVSQYLAKIHQLKNEQTSLRQELAKATDINSRQTLFAPVAGQVQQLAINTTGGIVTDAQQLMVIVPNSQTLEVEAFLENKDIGFVRESMAAEIKVHTFPFTRYGVIHGGIKSISEDAINDEQRGLVFTMLLNMDSDSLMINGKTVKLTPGMAVTAEIQTGRRKIIEFFLQPLLQSGQESLRER